ncbi:MAG: YeeE/YedE family protein [Spongiibacteraceae bacterium]
MFEIIPTSFTPLMSLSGGLLIGLSALVLLYFNGRIAGISGVLGGLLSPAADDRGWRLAFLVGLPLGAALVHYFLAPLETPVSENALILVLGGFIVGFGTRLGSGCTSGHGVCGIGRLSPRSLIATGVFMATGMLTVFVGRHLLGA